MKKIYLCTWKQGILFFWQGKKAENVYLISDVGIRGIYLSLTLSLKSSLGMPQKKTVLFLMAVLLRGGGVKGFPLRKKYFFVIFFLLVEKIPTDI